MTPIDALLAANAIAAFSIATAIALRQRRETRDARLLAELRGEIAYGAEDLPGRQAAIGLATLGVLAFVVAIPFGPRAIAAGAIVFLFATLVAIRETSTPIFNWPNAVVTLVFIIWLLPVKIYRLPVELPFALEFYRLFLLALLFVWVVLALSGTAPRVTAGGHGRALLLVAAAVVASQLLNASEIDAAAGAEPEALKALSYFLSLVLVFLLITSVLDTPAAVDKTVRALVLGATVVALAALYESRTKYNVFDHLHEWIPVFVREEREVFEERGGLLRAYASSQHPIALGCALLMIVPLALYAARRAASLIRSRLWMAAAIACATASLATVSRTTVVMLAAMVTAGVIVRGRSVWRLWPVLLVLPVVVHFIAPGALGGIYKSFFPEEGLVSELNNRSGQSGSGRLADVGPGLRHWADSPLLGDGLGSTPAYGDATLPTAGIAPATAIIFDNQYLGTLVSLGAIGLLGVLWFVWGSIVKLARAARRRAGGVDDLVAACSVSAAGFAASMLLFDAFSFVQATLVFFVVAALGFRARAFAEPPAPSPARARIGELLRGVRA